jgi:ankyrin repeat protein
LNWFRIKNLSVLNPVNYGIGIGFCLLLLFLAGPGCAPSIHDCVARGSMEAVKEMLDRNPALVHARDGKQKTPLHSAVTYKKIEAMEYLLEKGADLAARDVTGMTPLHVAAMLGRLDEAKWLLDHGANPKIMDDYGDMPIHTAAVFGHGQIIGLLVRAGMDPDIPNREGQTPAEIAHAYRQERVVSYLAHLREQQVK